jgi:hypothetical protein
MNLKNLEGIVFFELVKDKIGWRKYTEILSEYASNSLLDARTKIN